MLFNYKKTSGTMDQTSKRRGRPLPDAASVKPIAFYFQEALSVETQYRPNLLVIQDDLKPWEVNLKSRDGAIHVLRFLRIWFDLPHSVFFSAVTYLDLFLARMKVSALFCIFHFQFECVYVWKLFSFEFFSLCKNTIFLIFLHY